MFKQAVDHKNRFKDLKFWIEEGGPTPEYYKDVSTMFRDIYNCYFKGIQIEEPKELLMLQLGDRMKHNSLLGLIYLCSKELAGSYELVDKILTRQVSSDPTMQKWDQFFQALSFPRAFRLRKKFYKNLLYEKLYQCGEYLKVLYLGPGGGRLLGEVFDEVICDCFYVDYLGLDRDSALFNALLLEDFHDVVNVYAGPVKKFKPPVEYDIIICPFLLDFMSEKEGMKLIKALKKFLAFNGELVCSSLSKRNPSRKFLKLFGWNHHQKKTNVLLKSLEKSSVMVNHEKDSFNSTIMILNTPDQDISIS